MFLFIPLFWYGTGLYNWMGSNRGRWGHNCSTRLHKHKYTQPRKSTQKENMHLVWLTAI